MKNINRKLIESRLAAANINPGLSEFDDRKIISQLPIPRSSWALVYGACSNRFRRLGPKGGGNKPSAALRQDTRKAGQWRRSATGKRAA